MNHFESYLITLVALPFFLFFLLISFLFLWNSNWNMVVSKSSGIYTLSQCHGTKFNLAKYLHTHNYKYKYSVTGPNSIIGQFGTGQFGTADNLAPRTIWHRTIWHRTIWHRGQFGTADNLAPRTIWHQDNLAPRTIWHQDNLAPDNLAPPPKTDNLAPRTIWHHGQFGTIPKKL